MATDRAISLRSVAACDGTVTCAASPQNQDAAGGLMRRQASNLIRGMQNEGLGI